LGNPDLSIPVPDPITYGRDDVGGSPGYARVAGLGTRWRNAGTFEVGGYSQGELLVEQGGVVETGSFDVYPSLDDLPNRAVFRSVGTRLQSQSTIAAGFGSTLSFEDGATFSAGAAISTSGLFELVGIGTAGTVDSANTGVRVNRGGILRVADGATLQSTSIYNFVGAGAGDAVGPLAEMIVTGTGSVWDAGPANIYVAINEFGVDGGAGLLKAEDNGIVRADQILVGTGGTIWGHAGVFEADVFVVGGQILPGASPGRLKVDGDLSVDAASRVVIEVGGLAAGVQHDFLEVTGDLEFNGTLAIEFVGGFAPRAGDVFEFLGVAGVADLSGATIDIRNLNAGFQFELAPVQGGIGLIALTSGTFVPEPNALVLIALVLAGFFPRPFRAVPLSDGAC
ncbi:MAG: hypothetical protein KDA61_06695, partial [Planctomycetales bacterium]|nr:hypothetical protein [Planctomycetales bacterium]